MERKEFLEKFGIGMALICAGCGIASCGSTPKSEDPQPGNGNGNGSTPGSSLVTANLDSEIKEIGSFKIAAGIILVRIAQGNNASAFTAVQLACTHQGVSVGYNNAQGKFICPGHGSEFDKFGAVIKGPATAPLKDYNVAVNGNTLSVTA